jgi:acylphosphatase
MKRLTATVHGRVQGVGFRWFVVRTASRAGLTGWVANQPDGTVRVVAEGAPDALDQLAAALAEGPTGASVERVDDDRAAASGSFRSFVLRASAHPGD